MRYQGSKIWKKGQTIKGCIILLVIAEDLLCSIPQKPLKGLVKYVEVSFQGTKARKTYSSL